MAWHEQQEQVNNSKCNVNINHRFRTRRSVGETDTGKVQQKKASQPLAYDNMLGAGSWMQRIQDDMEWSLKDQKDKTNMH